MLAQAMLGCRVEFPRFGGHGIVRPLVRRGCSERIGLGVGIQVATARESAPREEQRTPKHEKDGEPDPELPAGRHVTERKPPTEGRAGGQDQREWPSDTEQEMCPPIGHARHPRREQTVFNWGSSGRGRPAPREAPPPRQSGCIAHRDTPSSTLRHLSVIWCTQTTALASPRLPRAVACLALRVSRARAQALTKHAGWREGAGLTAMGV